MTIILLYSVPHSTSILKNYGIVILLAYRAYQTVTFWGLNYGFWIISITNVTILLIKGPPFYQRRASALTKFFWRKSGSVIISFWSCSWKRLMVVKIQFSKGIGFCMATNQDTPALSQITIFTCSSIGHLAHPIAEVLDMLCRTKLEIIDMSHSI